MRIERKEKHNNFAIFAEYCHVSGWGVRRLTYKTSSGLDGWIYWHLIHTLGTTGNYSALADLQTLQFTVTRTRILTLH
jgi:hypothetical protein